MLGKDGAVFAKAGNKTLVNCGVFILQERANLLWKVGDKHSINDSPNCIGGGAFH